MHCYMTAVRLMPKFAAVHSNLGSVLKEQGKLVRTSRARGAASLEDRERVSPRRWRGIMHGDGFPRGVEPSPGRRWGVYRVESSLQRRELGADRHFPFLIGLRLSHLNPMIRPCTMPTSCPPPVTHAWLRRGVSVGGGPDERTIRWANRAKPWLTTTRRLRSTLTSRTPTATWATPTRSRAGCKTRSSATGEGLSRQLEGASPSPPLPSARVELDSRWRTSKKFPRGTARVGQSASITRRYPLQYSPHIEEP